MAKTHEWGLRDFLARSSDTPFDELTLAKVLEALPRMAPIGPWIAGGALRRTILGQEPDSDFDFFFRDENQLKVFQASLLLRDFRVDRETEHHIQLRGIVGDKSVRAQLIKFAYYTNAAAVIDSFDFTICQFAYDGLTLTCGEFSLWDLARKRLAIHKITFPLSTMRRVLKYTNQGFTACGGALTAILTATADEPKLRETLHIQYID